MKTILNQLHRVKTIPTPTYFQLLKAVEGIDYFQRVASVNKVARKIGFSKTLRNQQRDRLSGL